MMSLANNMILWSSVAATLLLLMLGAAAWFGFKEARNVRRASSKINELQKEMGALKIRLEEENKNFMEASSNSSLGEAAYQKGAYFQALRYFKKAENRRQDDPTLLAKMGRCHVALGQEEKAVIYFEKARVLEPRNAHNLTRIASVYRYDQPDKAHDYINKALEIDPNDYNALNYLGLLYRDEGKFEDAIDAHRKSLRRSRPETYFFLSLLYAHLKNNDQSKAMMQLANFTLKGQETNPDDEETREVWKQLIFLCDDIMNEKRDDALKAVKKLKENLRQGLSSTTPQTRSYKSVLSHLNFLKNSLNDQSLALANECIDFLNKQ